MPYTLSPQKAYSVLLKDAAVLVDANKLEILGWHPKNGHKAGIVAFVDIKKQINVLEISFGTATPYGRKRQNPRLPPRARISIEIGLLLWEYVKWVIYILTNERCAGGKDFFLNQHSGKKFVRVGKSLKVKRYNGYRRGLQRPIRRGLMIGVSGLDIGLLRRFFAEETQSFYWRKRIGWFDETVNRLMANWGRGRSGIKALKELVSDCDHACFLRREVLQALLPKIGQPELFLDALEECRAISFLELQELSHELPRLRKQNRNSSAVTLDFVFRGKRRNGSYRFEVFPDR